MIMLYLKGSITYVMARLRCDLRHFRTKKRYYVLRIGSRLVTADLGGCAKVLKLKGDELKKESERVSIYFSRNRKGETPLNLRRCRLKKAMWFGYLKSRYPDGRYS